MEQRPLDILAVLGTVLEASKLVTKSHKVVVVVLADGTHLVGFVGVEPGLERIQAEDMEKADYDNTGLEELRIAETTRQRADFHMVASTSLMVDLNLRVHSLRRRHLS